MPRTIRLVVLASVAIAATFAGQPAMATTGNEWMALAPESASPYDQGHAYGLVDAVIALKSGFGWNTFTEDMESWPR